VTVSPTYVPDLVDASLDLLIDGERGVWHLANQGALSWVEFAAEGARLAGIGTKKLHAVPHQSLQLRAARPLYSALTSERGLLLPSIGDALERYIAIARLLDDRSAVA
jgi:dTDP-4-dehydrorhamnose reductase